ncbi:MAG TPA: class I SAM-dependent methyltransferase [Conexibacter sp.]|nr:class I SAM-dependent methyltransferase [Conexibacter sp.]
MSTAEASTVTPVIAESPDATRAATTCAWCEQQLVVTVPRGAGRVRCVHCGATTVAAWSSDHELAPAAIAGSAGQGRRPGHARLCSLGEAARRHARRRLALRIERVAPPGAVLDVGSGDSLLLEALRATGRRVTGIARPAREGTHDAEITELGGRYAAIVFWQSLGRLRAPGVALEHAAALLKPGGLLAIAQPSAAREQARAFAERVSGGLPRERVHIPEPTLVARLRALGLEVEHVDHLLDADRLVAGQAALGWLHGVLGGIVAIEARR